ncbi:MAG: hypothetical protein ACJAW2_001047, partial [Shewanella sp.]
MAENAVAIQHISRDKTKSFDIATRTKTI